MKESQYALMIDKDRKHTKERDGKIKIKVDKSKKKKGQGGDN